MAIEIVSCPGKDGDFPYSLSLAVGEVARRLSGDQALRISAAGFAAAEAQLRMWDI